VKTHIYSLQFSFSIFILLNQLIFACVTVCHVLQFGICHIWRFSSIFLGNLAG